MERTVPRTDTEEIDLYIRTYYSLLRSSGEVAIDTLVETHMGMDSLLHPNAGKATLDTSALIYTSLRLPPPARDSRLILLGQRSDVFERWGYPVSTWEEVSAPARRRRAYYDGDETLALYIASRSDIDDIIPVLTAYQIEWNKLHATLSMAQSGDLLAQLEDDTTLSQDELAALVGTAAGIDRDDVTRLWAVWGAGTVAHLRAIAAAPKRFFVRLLAGSLTDYRKAMRFWWLNVQSKTPTVDYSDRRVYFVSSNTHGLVNLWSGYALAERDRLVSYIESTGQDDLLAEYADIETNAVPSSRENFLYYTLKKYLQDNGAEARQQRREVEQAAGIQRATSEGGFELDAQVIRLNCVQPDRIDPRLCLPGIETLRDSEALIFNIDYPLGLAAYELLTRIAENVGEIAGIYAMGKAATLNGRVGDVMIPTVVHDEHSLNTYLFNNCFTADDVAHHLIYGTVLDNQKSVSVRGTFLQNDRYMGVFYREGYTDIEMEAGPYLSAVYELIRPKRHPYNEIVSLHPAWFDIGLLHYASDKPLSKGKNLGAGSLSYRGMDPSYASAVAVLRRIIAREVGWIAAHPANKTSLTEREE
jgi:hypothetical protein